MSCNGGLPAGKSGWVLPNFIVSHWGRPYSPQAAGSRRIKAGSRWCDAQKCDREDNMLTRKTCSISSFRLLPHHGCARLRGIRCWGIRLFVLCSLHLLLLGCAATSLPPTRSAGAQADTVATQDIDPSVAPASSAPTDLPTSAYVSRAVDSYDQHDFDGAIGDYTHALALQPDSADAYLGRGLAYYGAGDLDRAIADFTQALALRPDMATIYNNRGLAYYDKDDFDHAIADFTRAIALQPNLAEAYYNRGRAYYDQGAIDQAIEDYTQALT
jgi:tetratricopeptide (TPR) repeat protein